MLVASITMNQLTFKFKLPHILLAWFWSLAHPVIPADIDFLVVTEKDQPGISTFSIVLCSCILFLGLHKIKMNMPFLGQKSLVKAFTDGISSFQTSSGGGVTLTVLEPVVEYDR